jgi:ribosomal protein L7/L12
MEDLLEKRLKELAMSIGRLERKTDFVLRHLNLEYVDRPEDSIPPELVTVFALLKQGKKVEAIREYRQRTGANAATAMTEVEKLESGLNRK